MNRLITVARLVFGAWMLLVAANHLFLSLWPVPTGQLMSALVNSRLLDVAMVIQLAAGALLLTGLLIPVALYALMPICTCALFWAGILNQQPLETIVALAAFALNGLLMLAYLPYYHGALQRRALSIGEA